MVMSQLSLSLCPPPATVDGLLTKPLGSLTDRTVIKSSPGRMLRVRFYNPNASVAFVQVHDSATVGGVTLGSTTPVEVIPVAAGASYTEVMTLSYAYASGIVVAATTTAAGGTLVSSALQGTIGYV